MGESPVGISVRAARKCTQNRAVHNRAIRILSLYAGNEWRNNNAVSRYEVNRVYTRRKIYAKTVTRKRTFFFHKLLINFFLPSFLYFYESR